MTTYSTPVKIETFVKGTKNVAIYKVEKAGTKRVFFFPVANEKRMSSTLFGRKNEAVALARTYLNS